MMTNLKVPPAEICESCIHLKQRAYIFLVIINSLANMLVGCVSQRMFYRAAMAETHQLLLLLSASISISRTVYASFMIVTI